MFLAYPWQKKCFKNLLITGYSSTSAHWISNAGQLLQNRYEIYSQSVKVDPIPNKFRNLSRQSIPIYSTADINSKLRNCGVIRKKWKAKFLSHGLLTNQPSSLIFQMSLVFFLWSCLQTEAYRGKKRLIHSLKMAISSPEKKKRVKGQATHSLFKPFRFPRLAGRLPVSWLSSKTLQLKCHQILTQLHKPYFFTLTALRGCQCHQFPWELNHLACFPRENCMVPTDIWQTFRLFGDHVLQRIPKEIQSNSIFDLQFDKRSIGKATG